MASARGGVLTPADAIATGVSPTQFRRLVRQRRLVKLLHGVYADASVVDRAQEDPLEWLSLRCAASMRCARVPACVAGPSATALHGLPVPRETLDTIVLWRPTDVDRRGLSQATCTTFVVDESAIVSPRGFALLDPPTAAVHSALTVSLEWAVAGCDAVLVTGAGQGERMKAALDRISTSRGRATAAQAVVLARAGAESPLESISRVRLQGQGLPEPRLQVPMFDDDGFIGRLDMWFEELGVAGEADGLGKYATRDDVVREKLREDRLRRRGVPVVRWTWDDIWRDPARVARWIRMAAATPLPRIT
jgi:hypothetical protein